MLLSEEHGLSQAISKQSYKPKFPKGVSYSQLKEALISASADAGHASNAHAIPVISVISFSSPSRPVPALSNELLSLFSKSLTLLCALNR